jgi:hypothetical protein
VHLYGRSAADPCSRRPAPVLSASCELRAVPDDRWMSIPDDGCVDRIEHHGSSRAIWPTCPHWCADWRNDGNQERVSVGPRRRGSDSMARSGRRWGDPPAATSRIDARPAPVDLLPGDAAPGGRATRDLSLVAQRTRRVRADGRSAGASPSPGVTRPGLLDQHELRRLAPAMGVSRSLIGARAAGGTDDLGCHSLGTTMAESVRGRRETAQTIPPVLIVAATGPGRLVVTGVASTGP